MTAVRYDWLVVGAGLSGATLAERIASQLDQRVLVVDRRPHLAGNVYDEVDPETGIRVHRYGPHIFHTASDTVWDYLSGFTEWLPYTHRVLGRVDGKLVPIPCNLNTLRALLPEERAEKLEKRLVDEVGYGARVPVLTLLEHEDAELQRLGEFVYEKFFLHYNLKQWGLRPEEIDRSVSGRVPVVVSEDDRYFRDAHQAIPAQGYTALVAAMLDHPNIDVELGVDGHEVARQVAHDRMIWTGPIDAYFGHSHGDLPYRSLRFEYEVRPGPDHFQPVAQVNHPGPEDAFTRCVEHAHFEGAAVPRGTVLTREFPEAHRRGENEPYYPVLRPDSHERFRSYATEAAALGDRVIFSGRLADFRYYDMDQAVAHALQAFRREVLSGGA